MRSGSGGIKRKNRGRRGEARRRQKSELCEKIRGELLGPFATSHYQLLHPAFAFFLFLSFPFISVPLSLPRGITTSNNEANFN